MSWLKHLHILNCLGLRGQSLKLCAVSGCANFCGHHRCILAALLYFNCSASCGCCSLLWSFNCFWRLCSFFVNLEIENILGRFLDFFLRIFWLRFDLIFWARRCFVCGTLCWLQNLLYLNICCLFGLMHDDQSFLSLA